jgi:hypothetical protein
MTTYTCRKCGNEGFTADAMLMRKGKPSQVCRECWTATRNGGGATVAKATEVQAKTAKSQPAAAPEPVKLDGLSLEIARGYGFRASAEDGQLVIEQDAEDGATATVVFSRTEFKVLAAQFAEWSQA